MALLHHVLPPCDDGKHLVDEFSNHPPPIRQSTLSKLLWSRLVDAWKSRFVDVLVISIACGSVLALIVVDSSNRAFISFIL
ncbi:hypothetical protein SESBI_34374 [Sesbania bispinosa]|nr:hypothetical protein SESBI_34374 [Sesbania bispinosa]